MENIFFLILAYDLYVENICFMITVVNFLVNVL